LVPTVTSPNHFFLKWHFLPLEELSKHGFRSLSSVTFFDQAMQGAALRPEYLTVAWSGAAVTCVRSWVSLTGTSRAVRLGALSRHLTAPALEGHGMACPRCHQENPAEAHFCMKCGASLTLACAKCNTKLPKEAAFCFACGQPVAATPAGQRFTAPDAYTPRHLAERILTSKAALEGERKQVTVLFADLKGSMELLADRDPEEARKLLDPVLEQMMEAVHCYEGTVNQVMGDGVMALFGAPLAQEDHAVRACYAALRMQGSVKRYAAEVFHTQGLTVRIRAGINSGEVVVRSMGSDLHMDYTAVGQTTHLAARMEQLADPGGTLITGETLRLAEGFVHVNARGKAPVKGLSELVEVFELTGAGSARTRLQASAARGLTKFVGRGAELAQMFLALERSQNAHGQVLALVGEPGVGKSR